VQTPVNERNQLFIDLDDNQIFKQSPLLYLYSKSDKICDYKYVDETIERLKKKRISSSVKTI